MKASYYHHVHNEHNGRIRQILYRLGKSFSQITFNLKMFLPELHSLVKELIDGPRSDQENEWIYYS